MANEENRDDKLQAQMEFIINQQAQFAANIQAHDERLNRLENIVTRLANVTLNGQEEFNAKVSAITDAQIKTEETMQRMAEAQTKLAEAQTKLAESQAHTDKRLDALIDIVREGRNGKS